MNKFWSVLFFAVAMAFTWNLIHSDSAIGSETHSGIQNELGNMIIQTVQAKKPGAQNIRITRLWTETVGENKIRAVFAYRFTEAGEGAETLDQVVEGEAILYREPSDDSRLDKWVLQNVRTTGDAVTFSEGAVVTPAGGEGETDPSAPAAEPAPAPESH